MKRLSSLLLLSLLALSLNAKTEANPRPFTIPAIHEWKGGTGTLVLTPESRILYSDSRLRTAAELLAADLQHAGLQLTVTEGHKAADTDILFLYKPQKQLGEEGYTMDIARCIRVEATERGAMHAVQTLLQIVEGNRGAAQAFNQQAAQAFSFPQGKIADRPDYKIRGFMLDCGRKYIPLSYIRNLVRTMAYYKLNTLNVHLNDNAMRQLFHNNWDETYAAFRMESERFPGLTAEDGHYTKAEFRQFILDAAKLGVEIIPEIDVPAHSLCFSHYRPSLGSKEFGMDHLELTNPEVVPFVDSLFAEYLEGPEPVFAGPRVHIGTDEYSNKKQDITERFRALADHLIHTVESYGKQPCVWGSLTHSRGTTPVKVENVLMYAWYNGYAEPDSMMQLGYQLVSIPDRFLYIVPAAGYYYDYLNIPYIYKEWTPAQIGKKRFQEFDPHIEGGMFALWNDHVGNGISVADIHHRTFPALQAMAEKCWKTDSVRTCDEWLRLASGIGEGPGINDLGRYPKGTILSEATVKPASTRAVPFIGWPYRVSFDIETPATAAATTTASAALPLTAEDRGTALFRDDEAEFYLSDPASGRIGFARDGYLFTFRHSLQPGVKEHISIEGDNRETRLFVNGKLTETLGRSEYIGLENRKMYINRTLRFPLQRTDGNLRSRVTNLQVESR